MYIDVIHIIIIVEAVDRGLEKNFQTQNIAGRSEFIKNKEQR